MPMTPAHPAGRPPCAARCGAGVCAARTEEARFDARKVARMHEALRLGRFEVDAEVIADRLLARPPVALGRSIN